MLYNSDTIEYSVTQDIVEYDGLDHLNRGAEIRRIKHMDAFIVKGDIY